MSRAKRMYGNYESETFVDGTRRCVFCGEVKKLTTNFAKNGSDSDGSVVYRQDCKICYNVRRKANNSRNKKHHSDFIGSQKRRGEAVVDFTHQEWKEALIFFGGECAYCGCTPRRNQRLTRDHLVPVSLDGNTTQDNIVPACSFCNSSRNNTDFKEWYMRQVFFSQERLNKIFKWRSIMRQVGGENNG